MYIYFRQTLFVALFLSFANNINAQALVPKDRTVQLKTTTYNNPPKIRFDFATITKADSLKIYKKQKADTGWTIIATLPKTTTFFIDSPFVLGNSVEYRFLKDAQNDTVDGETYVYTGVELPVVEYRGKIVLIIDSTFITSLSAEINLLQQDLIGDGWQVITHYVSRTASVPSVKKIITTEYYSDTTNVKSALLIGHVPVPYSGNIYPDGHPDHKGAWPADVYYADMDTTGWTDNVINTTSATRPENDNIPGDGKFDQDSLPGPNNKVEIQLGRVDLYNLPKFSQTEQQLLAQYLNKNHNFRHKVFSARRRGLIDDRFGWWSAGAFASCGWRDFSSVFGKDSIKTGAYFNVTDTSSYLWAYACGGGTYTSANNVGKTDSFATNQPMVVFNMLLGSYFGDWDSQNNFLRAPLASAGWTLATIWSGIPYTVHHHMGMGETIGYTTQVSQNNHGTYMYLESATGVHLALMGDPSLRLHTIAPPANLTASPDFAGGKVDLSWGASAETVLGYHVYRLDTTNNKYNRLNSSLITTLNYADYTALNGNNYYMVRAMKLETGSGTYYNLSQGIFDTAYFFNTSSINEYALKNKMSIYPNPGNKNITIQYELTDGSNNSIIVVYDMIGKRLLTIPVAVNKGANLIDMDISSLSPGVYNIQLQAQEGTTTQRLVIAR